MYLTNCETYQLKTDLMPRSVHSRNGIGRSTIFNSENYSVAKISDIVAKEKKIKNGEIGVRYFYYREVIFKGNSFISLYLSK